MGAGYHGGFGHTKGKSKHSSNGLHSDRQGKHIEGHKNYMPGKSIFSGTIKEASALIKKYSGKGTPAGIGKERVDFGKVIGYYVDKESGKKYPTTMGIIHSSKSGKHIVPSKPKNFKGD